MNPEVFREYDVRGLVDRDLNPDFAHTLGRAIGTYARGQGVRSMALGRDCRLSSESYLEAVGRGMQSAGVDVTDIGLCATPMLYFSIRHFGLGGGVMVTGSHNPPISTASRSASARTRSTGTNPGAAPDHRGRELRRRPGQDSQKGDRVRLPGPSLRPGEHQEGTQDRPGRRKRRGGPFRPPPAERYGCRVTPLYCDPDGRFPNHFPDPTIPENLRELTRLVLSEGADAGIAYDGDADRIGVITDRGDVLWGDELLLLFSRFILKKNPGAAIIGEVKCSQKLYDDIARNGGRPIMWKAGHSLIKGKMKEEKALLAGEMSGHLFFADRYFGFDDAIYASIRLLEILSESGKKLSELLADVPRTCTTPEIRVDCPDRIKFDVVQAARDHFRKTCEVIDIDGMRVPFGDGWGLLRASNTQPVLVLRFEAGTEARLQAIRGEIEGVLQGIMADRS
jgi:phosphomannomutase/phosphoglucomutase